METVVSLIHGGAQLLSEWRASKRQPPQAAKPDRDTARVKWKKPPMGMDKCNVDPSFSSQLNRVGIGLCLRDEFRLFMGAKTNGYNQS